MAYEFDFGDFYFVALIWYVWFYLACFDWQARFGRFGMVCLVWQVRFGKFGLVGLVWYVWFGSFPLVFLVWQIWGKWVRLGF